MRISNDTEGLRARWKQGIAALGFADYLSKRSNRFTNECRDVHSPIGSWDDVGIYAGFVKPLLWPPYSRF